MTPNEIEAWALRVIDRVRRGATVEDSRVEVKTDWPPDEDRVARRIAGHANASGGEPILWLVGVDEKTATVPGCSPRDFASWWPKVRSWFDGASPDVQDVRVDSSGAAVTALLFQTDRRPYVVRNKGYGERGVQVEREVPWRDGTVIRSARREDLLRLLVADARPASVSPLSARLSTTAGTARSDWNAVATFYVAADGPVAFPVDLMSVAVAWNEQDRSPSIVRRSAQASSPAVSISQGKELVEVRTSGVFLAQVTMEGRPEDGPRRSPVCPVSLRWRLREIGSPFETLICLDVEAQPPVGASPAIEWTWSPGSPFERLIRRVP